MTAEQIADSAVIRAALYLENIYVYRDPCTEGQTTEPAGKNHPIDKPILHRLIIS